MDEDEMGVSTVTLTLDPLDDGGNEVESTMKIELMIRKTDRNTITLRWTQNGKAIEVEGKKIDYDVEFYRTPKGDCYSR